MTKVSTEKMRRAYAKFVGQMAPTVFVTLAFNRTGTVYEARTLAKHYCGRMDRKLLGHEWNKTPAAFRTDGIFFVEHRSSNIHLHGILRFPKGTLTGLRMTTGLVWAKLCPPGDTDVQAVYDVAGLTNYCTKEMDDADYADDQQIILVRNLMNDAAHTAI
jgi:hypothetical protein